MLTSYNLIDDEKATKKKKWRQEDLRILSFSGFNLTDVCLVFKYQYQLLFYNILSDCHNFDVINSLLNAFRLKKKYIRAKIFTKCKVFHLVYSSDYFFSMLEIASGKVSVKEVVAV
jgi:hypothetical protein